VASSSLKEETLTGKFERSRAIQKLRLSSRDRKSQILAAAMELFSDRGFHATRTRELAERAGVSEALIFRHFPTKEALIRAILELVGLEERVHEMEERLEKIPAREGLRAIAEEVLTSLRDKPEIFRLVFFGILETPKLASEFYRKFLSRLLALETRLFQRAFAEGNYPAGRVDPDIVARSFHGSLLFYNLAGAIIRIEPLPKHPKVLAEAIVNLYLPEVSS
jgi:TetR/AcrR family transcriptional regulator